VQAAVDEHGHGIGGEERQHGDEGGEREIARKPAAAEDSMRA
jgi:hypothetical protein